MEISAFRIYILYIGVVLMKTLNKDYPLQKECITILHALSSIFSEITLG